MLHDQVASSWYPLLSQQLLCPLNWLVSACFRRLQRRYCRETDGAGCFAVLFLTLSRTTSLRTCFRMVPDSSRYGVMYPQPCLRQKVTMTCFTNATTNLWSRRSAVFGEHLHRRVSLVQCGVWRKVQPLGCTIGGSLPEGSASCAP